MTCATSWTGTAYASGELEFRPGFPWGSCYSIFSFMWCFVDRCLSLCPFYFGHYVVCFRLTESDYLFGIFKLFFILKMQNCLGIVNLNFTYLFNMRYVCNYWKNMEMYSLKIILVIMLMIGLFFRMRPLLLYEYLINWLINV